MTEYNGAGTTSSPVVLTPEVQRAVWSWGVGPAALADLARSCGIETLGPPPVP